MSAEVRTTIEIELEDAADLIATWKANVEMLRIQRAELDNKISAVESRIARMQARIGKPAKTESNEAQSPKNVGVVDMFESNGTVTQRSASTGQFTIHRAPRGQNLDRIVGFFKQATGPQRVAMISKAAQVGLTSVQAVLKRHEDLFKKEQDGSYSYIGKK